MYRHHARLTVCLSYAADDSKPMTVGPCSFYHLQGVSIKSSFPLKFFEIFLLLVESFSVKFCKFVGNSYPPHIPTNFVDLS